MAHQEKLRNCWTPNRWATELSELEEDTLRQQPVQSLHVAAGMPKSAKRRGLPKVARDGSEAEGRGPVASCAFSASPPYDPVSFLPSLP